MLKNKLDYKLINLAIISFIVYLVYQTGSLWMDIVSTTLNILLPFVFAFALAYALYPIVEFLRKRNIKKEYAVSIVILIFLGLLFLMIALMIPLLFNQLTSLFDGIIKFINNLSLDYDFNLTYLATTLQDSFNSIISSFSEYISNGAVSLVNTSLAVIALFVIVLAAAIYILLDFDTIHNFTKKFLKSKSPRGYKYFDILDQEMRSYIDGLVKIMFISWIEYTLVFYIIGHPNAILLGFMAAIANIIPYFGGILNNVVAMITAFVISPALFFRTVVASFILSSLDSYVINPMVFGKTNKIHPLVVIFSVFSFGLLFGTIGIIISLPCAIIIISTYKFFEDDINEKINDIRNK